MNCAIGPLGNPHAFALPATALTPSFPQRLVQRLSPLRAKGIRIDHPALLSDLRADLRYAFRRLAKARGFTVLVVLTLAIGIGATTAIFSIVNRVVLQPLPYADSGQLVEIVRTRVADQRHFSPTLEVVEALQEHATALEKVAASTGMHGNLTGIDFPYRVFGNAVTVNYFATLGVKPLLGRVFTEEEGLVGKSNVLILNHDFWQEQFAGSPTVLGQVVRLNDEPYTILGVMPPGFRTEAGGPKAFSPLVASTVVPDPRWLRSVVARLRPGATVEQAQSEIEVLTKGFIASDPQLRRGVEPRVIPLLDYQVGAVRPTLFLLLGAVGMLLLIACVNVANLLQARASARQREFALLAALGADRRRIMRQLLTESLVLAVIGGGLGLLLAYGSIDALLAIAPPDLPRRDEIGVDHLAMLFTGLVTVITGIGFGLVPAWQAGAIDLTTALKEGGGAAGASRRVGRLRHALVVTEVALAFTLLIGAGLLTRTYAQLQNTELGYDGDVIYAERVMLLPAKYPSNRARVEFAERAMDHLALRPELEAAAFAMGAPYYGAWSFRLDIETRSEFDAQLLPMVNMVSATTDYFNVFEHRLQRGRLFTATDREDTPLVAVISERVARRFFPDEDPIGQRIALANDATRVWREVVGIVSDIRLRGATAEPADAVYVPMNQHPTWTHLTTVVRVRPGSPNPGEAVAAAIHKVDPDIPSLASMQPLARWEADTVATQRFTRFLFGVLSGVALLLAALGIFGVLSQAVGQRAREIGVRMALGAQRGDILKLVVGQTLRLVSLGMILGIAGALAGARLLSGLLHGVSPQDPLTFIIISAILMLIALLAAYLPARRALSVNPLESLRAE
ncbi:MAG TPA: ABC transporter permease [Opitutaceae bacterium]|nr:ABC transporter permease [Opitutaceae bacterium]